jgi:hypothetical protein
MESRVFTAEFEDTQARIGRSRYAGPGCYKNCLVLLFTCLLPIPLARECFLDALTFAGLQVEGVTLYFLDDVLLLHLPLKPAQRIFERLAFLHTNLCQ